MFKNWSNRDWFWLISYLLFIIGILLANYYIEWETNLSIIANATSIALAVIAIFLSLKQDSDNRVITDSIKDAIGELRRESVKSQDLDRLFDMAGKRVESYSIEETPTAEKEEKNYSYDDLLTHGEKIKRETIEAYKNELLSQINEKNNKNARYNIDKDWFKMLDESTKINSSYIWSKGNEEEYDTLARIRKQYENREKKS